MKIQQICLFLAVATVLPCCLPLNASIIITYSGGSVTAGGSGVLNVFASSNALPGTPDNLDSFSANFLITPIGGAVSNGLQFADPQGDTQLGVGSYVFHLHSLGEDFAIPLGLVSSDTNTNDTYIAGDGTSSGLGIGLDNTSGSKLLFSLNLDAALANSGDQFSIALLDNLSTSFQDFEFTPLSLTPGSFDPFTVTAGAAAVPEPSTGIILLAGTAGFGWYRRRRNAARAGRNTVKMD